MSGRCEPFKVRDRVGWNSEAGHVSGTIIRGHTRDFDDKGHTHRASPPSPFKQTIAATELGLAKLPAFSTERGR